MREGGKEEIGRDGGREERRQGVTVGGRQVGRANGYHQFLKHDGATLLQ